ncbi:MAG: hypothetical protein KDD58_03580 [Bdellovibrionales bacterium]|nr:hypothetical protein [Bdellovibrionales bacterium]
MDKKPDEHSFIGTLYLNSRLFLSITISCFLILTFTKIFLFWSTEVSAIVANNSQVNEKLSSYINHLNVPSTVIKSLISKLPEDFSKDLFTMFVSNVFSLQNRLEFQKEFNLSLDNPVRMSKPKIDGTYHLSLSGQGLQKQLSTLDKYLNYTIDKTILQFVKSFIDKGKLMWSQDARNNIYEMEKAINERELQLVFFEKSGLKKVTSTGPGGVEIVRTIKDVKQELNILKSNKDTYKATFDAGLKENFKNIDNSLVNYLKETTNNPVLVIKSSFGPTRKGIINNIVFIILFFVLSVFVAAAFVATKDYLNNTKRYLNTLK